MNRLLLLCVFSSIVNIALCKPPVGYLEITAAPGDGIYLLLRKYQLDQFSCNFSKFYELNNIKKNAPLKQGAAYKLPILIYPFNGKTIRSSIAVDNWDLAVGIQNYNEQMLKDGLRNSSFKTDRMLWVPYHTFNCANPDLKIPTPEPITNEEYEKVSNPGNRVFPIFGKAHENTPLLSNKLQGEIYYIVSGHGGPDPGAIGKRSSRTLCEDEYAYDVALRLCRKLLQHGATAYMIVRDPNDGIRAEEVLKCDEDEVVWGGFPVIRSQKGRLMQRSNIINDLYKRNRSLGFSKQTTLVIHVDSRSRNQRIDLFFYHQNKNPQSKLLAQRLHKTMQTKYAKYRKGGAYQGTVKTRDLHMLREVESTSVYIELANIKNINDQKRIVVERNRELLSDWLYEGLIGQ